MKNTVNAEKLAAERTNQILMMQARSREQGSVVRLRPVATKGPMAGYLTFGKRRHRRGWATL